jgi:ArsR family transcriptional regulator, arsenate/arsenite/antimonite-responsive transcriptional repressor
MKNKTATRVDVMFRAFSDRTRLRVLHLLAGGELCVCDLVDVLGVPQPKASRHLAYLRKAELVVTRKEGHWSYYQLASARNPFHAKLLDCLACCFQDVPELAKDSKRLAARVHCCKRKDPYERARVGSIARNKR